MGKAKRNRKLRMTPLAGIAPSLPKMSSTALPPQSIALPDPPKPANAPLLLKPNHWLIPAIALIIIISSGLWWIGTINGLNIVQRTNNTNPEDNSIAPKNTIIAPTATPFDTSISDESRNELLPIENRSIFMHSPWDLNSDGYSWNKALGPDKHSLCISLANRENAKGPEFYQNALDAYYNTPDPNTLNTKIIDALDQIGGN